MTFDVRLAVAGSHVISETIEGETVVINLDSGIYFCLGGTASEVWEAAMAGSTLSQLAARLEARYEVDGPTIQRSLEDFLSEIQADGLLRRDPSGAPPAPTSSDRGGERTPFVPPTVQRFTDIKDLLLLDPIHEVDDRGWPSARTDG
jgi:hypothetical protein